jgi:quinoprotein glucose dehydrogenase
MLLSTVERLWMRGSSLLVAACLLTATSTKAQQQDRSWSDYGGGPDNNHFYEGDQITRSNVDQLEVAWTYPTGDAGGYQYNPLVAGGMMYVYARNNSIVALDAATGEEVWIHEGLQGITRRGLNYWESEDGAEKRLFFVLSNTLQAIDAETGESITSFGENGFVDLRQGLRREPQAVVRIQSNNPGKIFEDLLIMGSATGESYLSPPGDLRAFDVRTGDLVWQFNTIPLPGEPGYDTWPEGAHTYIGGANTWGELTVDEGRGIAYFPTGSATYDFYGGDRPGENLYANCLLALDARTGELLWYQQLVHHDLWDYDPTSGPQLVTVERNGDVIDAVAQATKHGYLYVYDRMTGEPVFPIEERPFPASDVPDEEAWPTQPIPALSPFGRLTYTAEDINPYLPEDDQEELAEMIEGAANEGLYTPPAAGRVTVQMPGNRGGNNWGMTSTNPEAGIVYVSNLDAPAFLELDSRTLSERSEDSRGPSGSAVYERNCEACHGEDGEGIGTIPALTNVVSRLGVKQVQYVISNGQGQMPPIPLEEQEFARVLIYLESLDEDGEDDRAEALPDPPAGPVVASGGAPAAREFVASVRQEAPPSYGRHEGPPYPEGIDAPEDRYYTDYHVTVRAISPPWTTYTAYDLNTGRIKWQIPIGEDPDMVERGIRNSGVMQEQKAPIVTSTGLLLAATTDGHLRALDAETGSELWKTELPGIPGSFPAVYEIDGRPYVAVSASRASNEGGDPSYVVFTLPE